MSTLIPPSANGQLVELDFRDLVDHPLLAGIPMWAPDSAEAQSLRESIRDRGLDYPLLVDNQRRIVDGRNRRNAIRALGGLGVRGVGHCMQVPCRVIDEEQSASVVVSSLVNRRHLTKGALAYLVAPLFENVLAEAKARRLVNLRQSGPGSESALSAVSVKTAADIAASLGIGGRLFEQALKVRALFSEMGEEVRATYEPRILGDWLDELGEWNDPVGLGYMINGLTSLLLDKAAKKDLGKRSQHDRLFAGFLPKLSLHWTKATADQRSAIAAQLRAEVLKFPAELREEIAAAVRAAAKAEKA